MNISKSIFFGIIIIFAYAAFASTVDASTDVGGTLSANTTWSLEGSPYILTSQVVVPSGVTLTIAPGVQVLKKAGVAYPNDSGIFVHKGSFSAVGTADARISIPDIRLRAADNASITLSYADMLQLGPLTAVGTVTATRSSFSRVEISRCVKVSFDEVILNIAGVSSLFGGSCDITMDHSHIVATGADTAGLLLSDLSRSVIKNTDFEGSVGIAIQIQRNATLTADKLYIKDATVGIKVQHSVTNDPYPSQERLTMTGSEIAHTSYALYFASLFKNVFLTGNSIHDNVVAAYTPSTAASGIDLKGNWWGNTSGPYNAATNPGGRGDPISDKIAFTPWLTEQPFVPRYVPVVVAPEPEPDPSEDPPSEPAPDPTPTPDPVELPPVPEVPVDESPIDTGPTDPAPEETPAEPSEPVRTPVLIVPGVMGTELSEGSDLLWLDLGRMFTDVGDNFLDKLEFDPQLEALHEVNVKDVISSKTFVIKKISFDYSQGLSNEFINQGYIKGENLFFFPYDWRYGASQNIIDKFKQKIEEIKLETGSSEVDIVAHSNGGLIVKKYIFDHPSDSGIRKAIFVGVPNTGAPNAIKTLVQGDEFGIPFLSEAEMKKLAQNLPVVYDLAPSTEYYAKKGSYYQMIERGLLGTSVLNLTHEQTEARLAATYGANLTAMENSRNLHIAAFDNYDMRTAGVDVYAIDGCKAGTFGGVAEVRTSSALGNILLGYGNVQFVPGDNTVPFESSTNLPINESHKFYALKADHSKMLSQDGIRQKIVNVLSGSSLPIASGLIAQDISQCQLNGRAISIYSPVSIDIVDSNGNHAGISEDGESIENSIPNAEYEVFGDHKFVYLPTDEGQVYTINLRGTESGEFTLTVANIDNNSVVSTQVFSDITVDDQFKGTVVLGEATVLSVDADGDGDVDSTLEPDEFLDAESSKDFYPMPDIQTENSPSSPSVSKEEYTATDVSVYSGVDVSDIPSSVPQQVALANTGMQEHKDQEDLLRPISNSNFDMIIAAVKAKSEEVNSNQSKNIIADMDTETGEMTQGNIAASAIGSNVSISNWLILGFVFLGVLALVLVANKNSKI